MRTQLRHLADEVDQRVASGPPPVLMAVSQTRGVIPRSELTDDLPRADSFEKYKVCVSGDLVLNRFNAYRGSLGVAPDAGMVSPDYLVLRPRHSGVSRFLEYWLRSSRVSNEMLRAMGGLGAANPDESGFSRIDVAALMRLEVEVNGVAEQRRIAEFLDRETAQIDELIAKQKELISTLAERQAELLLRAVTRGLREGASLVESGVPWLGKTPDHWLIGGLGRRVRVTSGFPFKSDEFSEDESDWRLLRGINIGPQRIKWDETVYWARKDLDGLEGFELRAGDLVLGLDRPVVSDGVRVALLGEDDVPALLLQRVARVRPSKDLDVEFLMLALSSRAFVDYLAPIFTGVSVPHMSPDQLKQFTVAFPPIVEQREIAAHVRLAERQTAELIHTARRFVETLQERRQALISAAVTGQIDVGGTS